MKDQLNMVRNIFKSKQNQWIPLYELTEIAAQYNARIYTLRREGMEIINRTKTINGVKNSWYKYVTLKEEKTGQLTMRGC